MAHKEGHGNRQRGSSLKGCRKLAGDNPGQCAIMTPRPGGAPEQSRRFKVLKVIKGIIPKSTVNLRWPWWPSARTFARLRKPLQTFASTRPGGGGYSSFSFSSLCPLCLCLPRRSGTKAGGKNLAGQLTLKSPGFTRSKTD
jgi:hypothetical protein